MPEPRKKTKEKANSGQDSKKERKLLVLLDSHAIIHRAYHALPEFSSSTGVPTGALYGLSSMLMGIIEKFKPDYIVACYDLPQPTYRHEAYKDYKAGRKKADDELVAQLKSSRDIFNCFSIPMYDLAGFEADDMLGTIVDEVTKSKDMDNVDIMIASGDMDTLQLIQGKRVRVFTLKKGIKDTVIYDEDGVVERFGFKPLSLPDYKGLRGDTSDNIIGIPGIGEKTGATLISAFETIEKMYEVLEKDPKKVKDLGITDRVIELLKNGKEEAEFSKMLATIRRDAPIDFKLPDHEWLDDFSLEKAEAVFRQYEFRSLTARLKQFATGKVNGTSVGSGGFANDRNVKNTNDIDADADSASFDNEKGTSKGKKKKATSGDQAKTSKLGAMQEMPMFKTIDPELEKKLKLLLSILNSTISEPTFDDLYAYTGSDDPVEMEKKLLADIKAKGLEGIAFDIELPLIPIIEKMEMDGIKIDVDFLKKLGADYHKTLSSLEKRIWKESGVEFNINSPKQLGEVLFDKLGLGAKNMKKTSTGAKSTKESELEKMKGSHPVIDLVLEYRELAKLLGTYIDVLPGLVDSNNRLHTHFLQIGAATGRMASKNPGIQNIPIKTDLGRAIRRAFICEEGSTLVSFDYSQVELRIAAILSKDEGLVGIFKKGTDVHTGVAAQVFNVAESEVTKDMRRQAKVINFGILYGMGVNALKANLGSTREEAQKFYNEYFSRFGGLAFYLEKTKADAAVNGYTETLFGRKRYFEGIKSRLPFIRAAAERMAINAPIQGTNADMVKISMKRIHAELERDGLLDKAKLILQVHDELVYEIRTPDIKRVSTIVKRIMESVLTKEQSKGVPIITSANAGKNWGEQEPVDL